MNALSNTHDWNYDKPYEWGLETLTEKTFVKKNFLSRIRSSQSSLLSFTRIEGEENVFLKKIQIGPRPRILSLVIGPTILVIMYKNISSIPLLCYRFTQKLLLLLHYHRLETFVFYRILLLSSIALNPQEGCIRE